MSFPIDAAIAARWREAVFVCSKCMKRQHRKSLRGELRDALKAEQRKDIRVVSCGCLDLCPKRGVSVMRGRDAGASPPALHVLDNHESVSALAAWLLTDADTGAAPLPATRRDEGRDRCQPDTCDVR